MRHRRQPGDGRRRSPGDGRRRPPGDGRRRPSGNAGASQRRAPPALAGALRTFARLWPAEVDPSDELVRSLSFLGARIAPETVVRAGYGAGVAVGLGVLVVAGLAGIPTAPGLGVAVLAAVGTVHAVHDAPVTLARTRRTSALGTVPDVVGRAVLRMRVVPSLEAAAAFAARTGDGPLAASLDAHVARAAGTPRTGVADFAAEWAPWFPELRRAALLLESAARGADDDPGRPLDRAMAAALDGTRDRMASFASEVRGPATEVYAFGVLLPLALVSVLPATRAAGLPASLPAIAAVYDLLLPASLAWAGWQLLASRPVAFRPPVVPSTHPAARDRRWIALAVGGTAAVAAWLVAGRLVAGWAAPLAAAGWGPGAGLVWWFRPIERVRDRARAVERGLPDALSAIGRRVADGQAVETAVAAAAEEVPGPTDAVLADAARRVRQLRVGLGTAFVGEHGPLATLPSPRSRSVAAVLALAAREGRPAGAAAVAMADHLDELLAAERAARRSLSRVTDTLRSTAATFGPLVGGATVALAEGVTAAGGTLEPLPVAGLGLAVGGYVLAMAVLLTGLSVGLARGLDPALVGYRCGIALASAATVYLVAFRAAAAIV